VTARLLATVFDLDDTLIDTADGWPRVCAAFAARHGHRWRPKDTAALHGNGGWASYVAGLCGDGVEAAEVVEACTAVMIDECAAGRVRALPGAVELVREAARYGPVAVATASPRTFVVAVLDRLGLAPALEVVVCGEDVHQPKPAPEAYVRAAAGLGIPPEACLAVEDSPNGIRSAATAGLHVLAIPRGGTTLPLNIAHLPVARARDRQEALPLLTRLLAPEQAQPAGELRTPRSTAPSTA
jgi:HAD superfamily hydrolase (TIGR01509 family)